jgi:hypothetical protein
MRERERGGRGEAGGATNLARGGLKGVAHGDGRARP